MNKDYVVPAKKSLGQHFLNSNIVPAWMCDAADIKPKDTVLEIGPGTGVLTEELLKRKAIVHAIETDNRSITVLQERFKKEINSQTLYLYKADIKNGYPKDLEAILANTSFKVVANIPYYLSGFIVRLLLENKTQPKTISLLMQKEVVERIARDPKLSLAALGVRVFGTPKLTKKVSRGHFTPPPRVESAILAVTDIGFHTISKENVAHFFSIARTGFAHKRKLLASNLKNNWPAGEIQQAFKTANIKEAARAEDLSLEQWVSLANSLSTPTHNLYTEIST